VITSNDGHPESTPSKRFSEIPQIRHRVAGRQATIAAMVNHAPSETEPSENVAIELFIAAFPWRIQTLAQRLRTIVRSVYPDAEERMRPGWRVINYHLPVAKRRTREVAWVMVEPVHVHLGFSYGAWMREADTKLEGRAEHLRKVRYVTFEPGATIPKARLRMLLVEAYDVAMLSQAERFARLLDRTDRDRIEGLDQVSPGGR
jgi:hypothetical protein